jgi:hypothetical protein
MMYEDTLEKPKNPLRRAMRRRQKQVTFSDPTYRDAPQYDYSSEEEEGENAEGTANGVHEDAAGQNGIAHDEDASDITATNISATAKDVNGTQSQESQEDADADSLTRQSDEYVDRSKFTDSNLKCSLILHCSWSRKVEEWDC